MTDLILYTVLGFIFKKPIKSVADATDTVVTSGAAWLKRELEPEDSKTT